MRAGRTCSFVGWGCVILQRFYVTIDNRLPYGRGSETLFRAATIGSGIWDNKLSWDYEPRPDTDHGWADRINPGRDRFSRRETAVTARPPARRHCHSREEFSVLFFICGLPAPERRALVHPLGFWAGGK